MVRALLNLGVRIAKTLVYNCEYIVSTTVSTVVNTVDSGLNRLI